MYFLIAWNILLSIGVVTLIWNYLKLSDNVVRLNPPEYFDVKVLDRAGKLITQGKDTVMSTIQDAQKVTLVIAAVSKAGNPAALAEKPVWKTTGDVVTVENISTDGLSADIVATGALGSAVVSFEANKTTDSADGVVSGVFDVTVAAGPADKLVVTAETVSGK